MGQAKTNSNTSSKSQSGFTPKVQSSLDEALAQVTAASVKSQEFANNNELVAGFDETQQRGLRLLEEIASGAIKDETGDLSVQALKGVLSQSGEGQVEAFIAPVRRKFLEETVPTILAGLSESGQIGSDAAKELQDRASREFSSQTNEVASRFAIEQNNQLIAAAGNLEAILQQQLQRKIGAGQALFGAGQAKQQQKQSEIQGNVAKIDLGLNEFLNRLNILPKGVTQEGTGQTETSQSRIDQLSGALIQGVAAYAGAK